MFLLEPLYNAAAKLDKHSVLTITKEIISEMAEVMWDVENEGITINW